MGLTGAKELKARMKAISADNLFVPTGKEWAERCADLMRQRVPNRNTRWSTGTLHDSIKPRKSRAKQRVVVDGRYTAYFVDAGTQGGGIHSRARRAAARSGGVGTIFARKARKARGYPARPFRDRSARDALARTDFPKAVDDLWNRAA